MKGTVLITPQGVCTCDAPWIRECDCWFSTWWRKTHPKNPVTTALFAIDAAEMNMAPGIPISELKAQAYTPSDNA